LLKTGSMYLLGFGSNNGSSGNSKIPGTKSVGKENVRLSCTTPTITKDVETVDVEEKLSSQLKALPDMAPLEDRPKRPASNTDAQAPEWLLEKVDDYITSHFYTLEAKLQKMELQVNDATLRVQSQETKVEELLSHCKTLIDMQFAESKKAKARDAECRILGERFKDLQEEVGKPMEKKLENMKEELTKFQAQFDAVKDELGETFEGKLRDRDNCMYTFEADLSAIKQSFTSLRMEMKKSQKGQDFKNTSTSVFLLKAIDMKPDERKLTLSKLIEHEEKCRGAVVKAEGDLRTLEAETVDNVAAVPNKNKGFFSSFRNRSTT